MTEQEKIEALEEVLDCEEGTLEIDTCLDDVEEWDSMSKLSLMSYVKKNFGHTLDIAAFTSFKVVGDIIKHFE